VRNTTSRFTGYEEVNDAERLSHDPTFRLIGSAKIWEHGAALTSRLPSFETSMLTEEEHFAGLARINRERSGRIEAVYSPQQVILDADRLPNTRSSPFSASYSDLQHLACCGPRNPGRVQVPGLEWRVVPRWAKDADHSVCSTKPAS